jgi:hypothetical protein
MAQLLHNMGVSDAISAVLSIVTGGGKWLELTRHADPLCQHLLLTVEKKVLALRGKRRGAMATRSDDLKENIGWQAVGSDNDGNHARCAVAVDEALAAVSESARRSSCFPQRLLDVTRSRADRPFAKRLKRPSRQSAAAAFQQGMGMEHVLRRQRNRQATASFTG